MDKYDCFNCKKHCWVFEEDGCASFCMEKGTQVPDKFASDNHFCCVPEGNNDYHDYHAGHA